MKRVCLPATSAACFALLAAAIVSADVSVKQWTFKGADAESRRAYFAQTHRFWGTNQYPDDPAFLGKMVTLSTGKTEFLLWCTGKVDPATSKWISSIGMGRPSRANWYQNSFYSVQIDGKDNHRFATELGEVRGGEKGHATVIWHHSSARITTTFTLLDGDDKLLVETKLEPCSSFKTYNVKLTCYPSSMARGYAAGLATRDREGLTAKRSLLRSNTAENKGYVNETLTKDEPWALFFDNYYDRALNRGEGPCAAAYSTKEAVKAAVSVQNCGCYLTLTYPSSVATSHVILWDLKGMPNAAAKEYTRDLVVE